MKDVTQIALAIIGVALLYVLVSSRNRTSQVIGAAASGFNLSLATAMGIGSPAQPFTQG